MRQLPANLVVEYARSQGPSRHEAADDDRYVQAVTAAFGSDFKQPIHERAAQPLSLPENGAAPIEPIHIDELAFQLVYPATWETTPPRIEQLGTFWRCGGVFYCGKDIPGFVDDAGSMPAAFVRALARAFDTGVVEYGWIC